MLVGTLKLRIVRKMSKLITHFIETWSRYLMFNLNIHNLFESVCANSDGKSWPSRVAYIYVRAKHPKAGSFVVEYVLTESSSFVSAPGC